jgi:ADP-ribose pyrophosphatase
MVLKKNVQVLARGRYLKLVVRDGWECVERRNISGIVIMVPVTREKKVILIEQYRSAVRGNVLEFPAGLVGDIPGRRKESLVTAARRELIEETGYRAKRMRLMTEGPPSPGISGEHITFYLATGLRKVGPGGGDASENITVYEVPLRKAHAWVESRRRRGVLVDPKIYTGFYFIGKMR